MKKLLMATVVVFAAGCASTPTPQAQEYLTPELYADIVKASGLNVDAPAPNIIVMTDRATFVKTFCDAVNGYNRANGKPDFDCADNKVANKGYYLPFDGHENNVYILDQSATYQAETHNEFRATRATVVHEIVHYLQFKAGVVKYEDLVQCFKVQAMERHAEETNEKIQGQLGYFEYYKGEHPVNASSWFAIMVMCHVI